MHSWLPGCSWLLAATAPSGKHPLEMSKHRFNGVYVVQFYTSRFFDAFLASCRACAREPPLASIFIPVRVCAREHPLASIFIPVRACAREPPPPQRSLATARRPTPHRRDGIILLLFTYCAGLLLFRLLYFSNRLLFSFCTAQFVSCPDSSLFRMFTQSLLLFRLFTVQTVHNFTVQFYYCPAFLLIRLFTDQSFWTGKCFFTVQVSQSYTTIRFTARYAKIT